ncbi:trafficking protein particle complex subunit 6A isoform X2 [Physeter macrocephalus]|uniref:Trafficking protein particle complex subunit 6A isoform X2 n=1 Tax=Physeter macrocephalus TaxID=9755 RepID=A0A9W2W7S6_PHYMC|nr:trafficking protein particle complex subunit 6A isoform X2 [Physeter catodon]
MDGDRVCVDHPIVGPQHGFVEGQKMSLSVLEGMGFRVGQALGERLPRETLAFREELDVLKFLCKDVWAAVFQKQMDSLRTNHQGTYVLQDNSFPLLIRMASGLQYLEEAPKFLAFTCGLLRGTLSTLGIKSLVTASVAALPASCFPWAMPAWRRQPLTTAWSSGFEHSSRHGNPASGGVTCVDSARLCHLLPDVGKYPHLRAVHRGCDRPKWEEEGVSSVGGAPLQAPHPAPPQRTQLSTRSLACLRAFAHAIPCLAHSPNSCSLSGVQQPPASAAHHIPRSSCSLAWRLQPWGGAPRQPCPALPPCLLVYVPPRFPLGPSGSLSWVLALSSTEPADVSQMNRSHSAKVCACGRGGGSGGSAQPCPQEAQGCPGGSPPRLTTPPLRHTSLASLMGQGCWEGGRVLNWQRTGRRKLLESLVRGGRSSPGEGRGIAGLQGAVSGHRALLCGCLPHLPGEPLFHPSRQQQPQGDGTLESRGRPPRPTLCLRYLLPSHPHPQPRSHLSKNSARRLHLPSTNHCLQSLALPP